MSIRREGHTATLLPNGKVLVAGGYSPGDTASCELYDPATGTWSPTGSMVAKRSGHKAVLQVDGTVLVAGGQDPDLKSTEVYNPATGTWSLAGALTDQRTGHTLTRLADGTTLVAGGNEFPTIALDSAEIYTPISAETMNVNGNGTFDSTAGTATFSIDVTGNGHGIPTGSLTYSDPDANVTFVRGRLRKLTIIGKTATIQGSAMLDNGSGNVGFTVTAVDNSADGSSDTYSVTLSNGYSESGTLTSGNITIQ
jgi:ribosomal protein L31